MPLSTFDYSNTNIPAFLSKLWTLVEDKKYDELIAWDASGYSFHVFDQTQFAREILPRFFKHNNMASFIRQLNMYGFRKVNSIEHGSLKNEKDDMEFHHPYFIRDKEQYLELIKRKVSSTSSNPIKKEDLTSSTCDLNSIDNSATSTASNSNVTINQANLHNSENLVSILQGVKTMHAKQADVVDKLQYLKRENEALWKEVASLRQKHNHQQQIVNKLIHFLVHLVNPPSMGIKRTRPLMIDSHSTLTNINDDNVGDIDSLNENLISNDNENNINNNNNSNNKRYSSFDHDYSSKKRQKTSANENNTVIIDDVTDNLPKSSIDDSELYTEEVLNDKQPPFVDFGDSQSSINNDDEDVEAENLLNSNLFLNTNENQNEESNPSSVNTIKSNENTNTQSATMVNNEAIKENNQNIDILQLAQPSKPIDNKIKHTISSLKYSSSHLMDHVESLQLDLNSLKDYFTTNPSFDGLSVNNVSLDKLFIPDLMNYDSHSYNSTISNDNKACNKITGNELIQSETLNQDMIFNIDDMLYPSMDETFLSTPSSLDLHSTHNNNNDTKNYLNQSSSSVTTPTNLSNNEIIKQMITTTSPNEHANNLDENLNTLVQMPFDEDFIINDNIYQQLEETNSINNNKSIQVNSIKQPVNSKKILLNNNNKHK